MTDQTKLRWRVNIAVINAWMIAAIWIPFPLYELIRHWPDWNIGFVLVIGGSLIGIVSIPAGYAR